MFTMTRFKKSKTSGTAMGCLGVLEKTTDLGAIKGRKVMVLLDEQNLSITARDLGYELKYGLLARRIREAAESARLHLFTASNPDGRNTSKRFEVLGYVTHVKTIRRKPLPDGGQRSDCNIDNLFAFWAGLLTVDNGWDVMVLASGDYGLSGELAEAICRRDTDNSTKLMTLSLPGSTAQDLDAQKNPNITANLEIGLDLLTPTNRSTRCFVARVLDNNVFQSHKLY